MAVGWFMFKWVTSDQILKIGFDPIGERVAGEPVALTAGTKPAYFPDPSPDGQWLTFCSMSGLRTSL